MCTSSRCVLPAAAAHRDHCACSPAHTHTYLGLWVGKFPSETHTHTHPFNGPLSGTTQVSQYQNGKTNLDFTEARDSGWQWHQLGHNASLHLAPDRQPHQHATTLMFFTGRMPFLPPNQQRQSTEGKNFPLKVSGNFARKFPLCIYCRHWQYDIQGAIKKFRNLAIKSWHIISNMLSFLTHSHATSMHIFNFCSFSAVYALKIKFSVSTLRPCIHSNLQWFSL